MARVLSLDEGGRWQVAMRKEKSMSERDRSWIVESVAPTNWGTAVPILSPELPEGDSVAYLHRATDFLKELGETGDVPLAHLLEALDAADRRAKNHQITLVAAYLEHSRLRKLAESRLWAASFAFWRAMGEAYMNLIRRFQAGGEESARFQSKMHLVVCRAIRALALQHKWTLLRYGPVEERIWRDLAAAFAVAARWDFANRRAAIYPGAHGISSPQEELLKPLMLSISAPDTLNPLQQHLSERLISYCAGNFAMHTTPGPGCMHRFDLTMFHPPGRAKKGDGPAPLLRYFGPGTGPEVLQRILAHVESSGTLPLDTPVSQGYALAEVIRATKFLLNDWSTTRPGRRPRREVYTRLTVVPGLLAAVRWLQQIAHDAKAEPSGVAESWVGVDASDGGHGAVLASPPDWLAQGVLVALRGEASQVCRVGLIRRISSDGFGQHRVGVELLGDGALPVALFEIGNRKADDLEQAGEPAILVSRRPDAEGMIELMYRPQSFQRSKKLQIRFRERVMRIEFVASVVRDADHHWARFRVVYD